jgi:hypothetical protein
MEMELVLIVGNVVSININSYPTYLSPLHRILHRHHHHHHHRHYYHGVDHQLHQPLFIALGHTQLVAIAPHRMSMIMFICVMLCC